jgi:hypothetical protein
MANPSQKVEVSLIIKRRLAPPIVAVMSNRLYALDATNQGIKNLNVLKGRRGIRPTLV